MGPDSPKLGQEDFFPTNPNLADILGRTDLDFENFPKQRLRVGTLTCDVQNMVAPPHFGAVRNGLRAWAEV